VKVTFIGHAAILIETQGLRILSDPWWEGPCFGTQWWVYPRADTAALGDAPLDYVYISHGHHDHLHLGTLRRLPAVGKVLVSSTLDAGAFLDDMGFDVWRIGPDEEVDLGRGVKARLIPTCNDDTLLAVDDGVSSCINLNDALHAAPEDVQDDIIVRLKADYPEPTYMFCGYGIASHFPACYVLPGMDREATVANRQAYFNRQWARIAGGLSPRFAFPFAADVAFLDEHLLWANEPIHNSERPTDVFRSLYPGAPTQVFDIAPGFAIDGEQVTRDVRFKPVDAPALKTAYAQEYKVANRTSKIPSGGLATVAELVEEKMALCRPYLAEFEGNYTCLIRLRDCEEALLVSKTGRALTLTMVPAGHAGADLVFTTRFSYLRRALTETYGGEVLYVGSGCTIEYLNPAMVSRNVHREMLVLLRNRQSAPPSRFGDQPKWLYKLKQAIKGLKGKPQADLYDLETWIVRQGRG
jgi:hypothetical protein